MSWFGKIKVRPEDKLFSQYIRKRDGQCVLCGATDNLQCSHYEGRRKENTRFDTDNCDTFCAKCHNEMEHEKGWTSGELNGEKVELPKKYTAWKMKQLGEYRYNSLKVRAAKTGKKDGKFQVMRIKELLKQLK